MPKSKLSSSQLANFGRVVTIGYASNPAGGIFELVWGDVELVDEETGQVMWRYWEQLPPPGDRVAAWPSRQPAGPRTRWPYRTGRFDDRRCRTTLA